MKRERGMRNVNRKSRTGHGASFGLFLLIFALCLLPLALSLSSCSGRTSGDGAGDITIWETYSNEEHEVFVKIVADFEREYAARNGRPVRVKVERLPFDAHIQKLKFAAITGTAPDIARVDAGELIDLVYGQCIMDLRTIDPGVDSYLAPFTPPARETVRIPLRQPDGSVQTGIYGIPDQITGVAVYYNRKFFRSRGIPFPPASLKEMAAANPRWDFDRFRALALQLTDTSQAQPVYGIALNSSLWFSLPIFNAYGAEFIEVAPDKTFRCTLGSESGVAALTALSRIVWSGAEAGAWQPGAVGSDQGFMNNNYAMIISGPWNLKQFEQAGVDFGVGLLPEGPNVREIPTPEGPVRVGTSTNVGGTDMAILKTSRNPQLCYEFLRYLTSPEVHARWCNEMGQIPVNTDAERLVRFDENPNLKVFMEQIRTAVPRPKIPRYGVLEGQIMIPQIDRAFRSKNEEGVRAALATAVSDIDRLILNDVNIAR